MLKTCEICGKEFEPKSNNKQKYCSRACFNESRKEYDALYRAVVLGQKPCEKKVCPHCGKEFMQTHGSQKFCSKKCKQDFHNAKNNAKKYKRHLQLTPLPKEKPKEKPVQKKVCVWCGEEFETTKSSKTCCSPECKRAYRKYYFHYYNLEHPEKMRPHRTCEQHINNFRRAARRIGLYWDGTC